MATATSAPARTGPIDIRMGVGEWAMLIALSLLWGGSFFFVAVAVEALPTLTIVALRVGLAAVALWAAAALLRRRIPRAPGVWAAFFAMGLLNNVAPFTLIVWGQQSIASGLAAILNATTPLFGVIVAGALLADERATPLRLFGAVVGFLGVALMLAFGGLAGPAAPLMPQLAILGAALSYACASVFGRRFRRFGVDPVVTAAGQVTASALLLAPVAIIVDRPWTLAAPPAGVWVAVAALSVLSTALAYILYFRLLARSGATNVLLVTLLVPVSAILLGGLFLGERLGPTHFAGMGLIALGLAAIDGRPLRAFRRRRGAFTSD